jgi:hypothetical protein
MNKNENLELIAKSWDEFINVAKSVSEFEKPGVVGFWNLRESLIHVAVWDYESMIAVQAYITKQEKPLYNDWSEDKLDALNAEQVNNYQHLSADEVWGLLNNNHQEMLEFLMQLSDEMFKPDTFTGDTISAETWQHYQGHKSDIEQFIKNKG